MQPRSVFALGLGCLIYFTGCGGGSSGSGGGGGVTPPQAAILTSIAPTSVPAGAAATTLQVTGSAFSSGALVTFNGNNLSTTYSSATSLSAVIPTSSLTSGETAEIAVVNPGAAASGTFAFAVDSPTPVLASVSPNSAVVGNAGTFTLTGTGFEPNSAVQLNGTAITTVFVSATSLTVNLTAAQLMQAGTAQLAVFNPSPAGGTSVSMSLQINQPTPVLGAISPTSVLAGSGTVTLTLTGTGFLPTATVTANGNALNVTAQSSTSITAILPATAVAQGGTVSLAVTNPGTNSESSSPQNLAVVGIPSIYSLTPAAASLGGADFTLTVSGTNFQPNSVINWNGNPLPTSVGFQGQLSATVPAVDIVGFATNIVTVSTSYSYPTLGVAVSPGQPLPSYLSLPNNDLVYNSKDGYLYASVPSSVTGNLGNSVVAIDPVSGNVVRQIPVGSNPNQIAISDDGTQLFVGLDGSASVRQVNLTTGQPGNQFYLGGGNGTYVPPFTAAALAVPPGKPNSVAVLDISGVIRIFDSGVARAQTSFGLLNSYFDSNFGNLSFGSSAAALYVNLLPLGGIYELTVGATGITAATNIAGSAVNGGLQYDNSRLYLANGTVLGANGTLLGTFSATPTQAAYGPVVSDATLGLAFVAYSGFGGGQPILVFNESNFLSAGSIPTNGLANSVAHIVRWGQDGLAFNTPTQIFSLQSPVVKDLSSSKADVSVALIAPAASTTGLPLTWTATVTNKGPSPAQGVTLTSTLADSLIVQSITPSQGFCSAGNEVNCNLGSLASGATATVTMSTVPSVSTSIETTAIVSSVSYDPVASNNQSTATTAVTGSLYGSMPVVSGISPALVQAGSTPFQITVTGSGFNSASTVEINGAAKLTTYVSSTQLTATVDAPLVANYGWAGVTVSNPAPGGGVSNVTPLTIYAVVNVSANGMSFDPFTRKIYATLPGTSTTPLGNSIVAVDPVTGNVGTPVNVGSGPNVMAETSDGDYLYIGLSGAASLARFNLLTQKLEATIPMALTVSQPVTAYGLSAMPGSDTTIAVDIANIGQTAILDVSGTTGTFRPNTPSIYTGNNPVFSSPTELYAFDNYSSGAEFYRFTVNAQGLTQIDGSTLNGIGGATNFPFVVANGTVYGASGAIVNPATTPPSQVATLSTFGLGGGLAVAPDPATAKDFMVLENTAGSFAYYLYRYDTNRYLAEAQLPLPVGQNGSELGYDMLRWGQDGLALRAFGSFGGTTPAQILLIRGPFVLPSELNANPVPTLTSASQTSIAVGSGNMVLTLSGSGFLPGAVALWNGAPRTTTFTSSTQLSVAIPASDVASAGSETVTVQNPGSAASGSVLISVH